MYRFESTQFCLAWVSGSPMGQGYFIDYTKISFVITSLCLKQYYLPFALKKETESKKKKGFDFLNVLPASKYLKMISKDDKSLKNITSFS